MRTCDHETMSDQIVTSIHPRIPFSVTMSKGRLRRKEIAQSETTLRSPIITCNFMMPSEDL